MGGGGGGGGGWAKPLQTLSQGLVLTFDFSLLALSLTITALVGFDIYEH